MSAKPKIIDLTKQFGTVETLTEARVNCSLEEKVCFYKNSFLINLFNSLGFIFILFSNIIFWSNINIYK
jgi:hypothetical protein